MPFAKIIEFAVVLSGASKKPLEAVHVECRYSKKRCKCPLSMLNSEIDDAEFVGGNVLSHQNAARFGQSTSFQYLGKTLRYAIRDQKLHASSHLLVRLQS